MRFAKQGEVEAKCGVRLLGACDGLENEINRRPLFKRGKLRGDVGKDAALSGDRIPFDG